MAKYTYIKKDINNKYVDFDEEFDESLYNNVGETWADYLDNKWVLLSNEQVSFHEEHPTASVKEVWDMQLTPAPQRTLAQAKAEMLDRINDYDNSSDVNGFTVNETIEGWFTPEERSNYMTSIDAAKLLGVDKFLFFIGDTMMEITPTEAEYMLSQIQLYADECYIITKQHKIEVESLGTIEEVDSYEYMEGYPEKINFTLVNNAA